MHYTLAEKFRILEILIKQLIQRTIRNYNERYHSSTKYSTNDIQQREIEAEKVKKNFEDNKKKIVEKL